MSALPECALRGQSAGLETHASKQNPVNPLQA